MSSVILSFSNVLVKQLKPSGLRMEIIIIALLLIISNFEIKKERGKLNLKNLLSSWDHLPLSCWGAADKNIFPRLPVHKFHLHLKCCQPLPHKWNTKCNIPPSKEQNTRYKMETTTYDHSSTYWLWWQNHQNDVAKSMYMMAKAPTVITWSPEYAECTDYKWHNIGCSIGSTQSHSQRF